MGFKPSGSGQVVKLTGLTPETKLEIERRIFGLLPDKANKFYREYRNRLTITFDTDTGEEENDVFYGHYHESDSEDDWHPREVIPANLHAIAVRVPLPPSDPPRPGPPQALYEINWRDFQILFNSRTLPATKEKNSDGDKKRMRLTLRSKTIEEYILMICRHVDRVRNVERVTKGQDPRPSCKLIKQTQWYNIKTLFVNRNGVAAVTAQIQKIMEDRDITKENFQNLDYIFMPVMQEDFNHYVLYAIAPKQKKVIFVNSIPTYGGFEYGVDKEDRATLFSILRYLVPREERELWTMDVDVMSIPVDAGPTIRRAVEQRDKYNCGIYVATNALLLAFGYDLKCFKPRELDQYRKQRMVAEFMNGGMKGLYDYDVFELPQTPTTGPEDILTYSYRDLLQKHRADERFGLPANQKTKERLANYDGESDSPGNVSTSSPLSPPPESEEEEDGEEEDDEEDDGEDDDNEDDGEARGLDNIGTIDSNTPQPPPLPIFPTASQCLAIDKIINVVRPESIKRTLNPQYTHLFGFLYPFAHADFDEAIQCSKEEMIDACIKFPITGYEEMSLLPKENFLDWIMNEMGATMSRIHQDPLLPFPGIGEGGYKLWLEWQESEDAKLTKLALEGIKTRKQDPKRPLSKRKLDMILAVLEEPSQRAESEGGKKTASSVSSRTTKRSSKSSASTPPSSVSTLEADDEKPITPRTSPRFAKKRTSSLVEKWLASREDEAKGSPSKKRKRSHK